jgi:hypothetical protein
VTIEVAAQHSSKVAAQFELQFSPAGITNEPNPARRIVSPGQAPLAHLTFSPGQAPLMSLG